MSLAGRITKTGNGHARRLLVEAAWHHQSRYIVGKTMRDRWDLAPAAARARGDAGNRRLHARWVQFNDRGKRHVVANVAIARELAGWCWSLAVRDEPMGWLPELLDSPAGWRQRVEWSAEQLWAATGSTILTVTLDPRDADPLQPNSTVLR